MSIRTTIIGCTCIIGFIYFALCTFGGAAKHGSFINKLYLMVTVCSSKKKPYKDRKGLSRIFTKLNIYFNETNHHIIMIFYYFLWIFSSFSVYNSFIKTGSLMLPPEDTSVKKSWTRRQLKYSFYYNPFLDETQLPDGYSNGLMPAWAQIMTYVLHLLSIISFTMASFLDPGTYKPNDTEESLAKFTKYPIDNVCYREERECNTCHHKRPIRCKHCHTTNRDVMKFDHFCPWVVNSIGERNIFHFNVFLSSTSIALINKGLQDFIVLFFNSTTPIDFISMWKDSRYNVKLSFILRWVLISNPATCLSFLLHIIIGIMLLFFAGYHFSLMISNKTTAYSFKVEDVIEDISTGRELLIRKILSEKETNDTNKKTENEPPFHDGLFLIPTKNIVSAISEDGKRYNIKELVLAKANIHNVKFSYREYNNEKNIIFCNAIIIEYRTAIKLLRRRNVYSLGIIGNIKSAIKAGFTDMKLSQYPNKVFTASDLYQMEVDKEIENEKKKTSK